jgi:Asp-tRNA(Asn)/Glu-tRNA(Gln) amidotransferase C subunit
MSLSIQEIQEITHLARLDLSDADTHAYATY